MTEYEEKLADAVEKLLPLAKFHSAGSKLDIVSARRVLHDFRERKEDDFGFLMGRARKLGGRVQIFQAFSGAPWTAGIYFDGGRKYEWGGGSTIAEALARAVIMAENAATPEDDCMGLA